MPDDIDTGRLFQNLDATALTEISLILVSSIILIVMIQRFFPWVSNALSGRKRLIALAMIPYFRIMIIIIAIFSIVPLVIEPSLQNMVAIFGSIGIAIGFALKDYVSGLIAGIVAIGELNYRNGDWVTLGNVSGEVKHIGLRAVEIVTADDDRVLVPHSYLWANPVINSNNGDARLQCVANFYLHPDHDAKEVKSVLEDVILSSPYLYFDDPIAVVVLEKPWGTHYRVKAYPIDSGQQFRFITDMTIRGKAALRELNVTFATPETSVIAK